jgi:hypothetical protein
MISDYRSKLITLDPKYHRLFITPFFNELTSSLDLARNNTLYKLQEDDLTDDETQISNIMRSPKVKLLFEDGLLSQHLLGNAPLPAASVILYNLYYSPSEDIFYVTNSYNYQPQPLCGNAQYKCPLTDFMEYTRSLSANESEYKEACGLTPKQKYEARVQEFAQTMNEAKQVKRSNYLRILELYALSMLVIIIMWACYSVFYGGKETQTNNEEVAATYEQEV